MARAVNVVDMMFMPAMPGRTMSRSLSLPENTAPKMTTKISGSRKLKKAADGLRQNIRRSRRNCRQV